MFAKEHAFWFFNPAAQHKLTTGEEYPEFVEEMRSNIADTVAPSWASKASCGWALPVKIDNAPYGGMRPNTTRRYRRSGSNAGGRARDEARARCRSRPLGRLFRLRLGCRG